MPCLLCRWFEPIEPDQHRQSRESGACQQSCGHSWDRSTAMSYVRHHQKFLQGFCRFNPQPLQRSCADVCGQFSMVKTYWRGLDPPGGKESLVDWSRQQIAIVRNGSWEDREFDYLRKQTKELRQELKTARQRSAARLAELRKLRAAKPKPEPKPVAAPANVIPITAGRRDAA
jgi:hypothetical protein